MEAVPAPVPLPRYAVRCCAGCPLRQPQVVRLMGADPLADMGLTPRQREVLDLLAKGVSNAELAAALCVSVAAVKDHVTALLAAFGVRTRGALVYRYWSLVDERQP